MVTVAIPLKRKWSLNFFSFLFQVRGFESDFSQEISSKKAVLERKTCLKSKGIEREF